MMNWRERLQAWMMGRYGMDGLNVGIMAAGMVCTLLSSLFRPLGFLVFLSYLCFGLVIFRMFSHNISARQRENAAAKRFFGPLWKKLRLWAEIWKNRKTHRYFHCPKCRQQVRVPKGKGKIRIICPRCRAEFIKKS